MLKRFDKEFKLEAVRLVAEEKATISNSPYA